LRQSHSSILKSGFGLFNLRFGGEDTVKERKVPFVFEDMEMLVEEERGCVSCDGTRGVSVCLWCVAD
jgi:hypothetical protein